MIIKAKRRASEMFCVFFVAQTEGNRLGPISKTPIADILGVLRLMSMIKNSIYIGPKTNQ